MQKQISTIISLKDRFSQPLLRMSDNVKSLDRETRSSMNRVNRWGKQVERSVDRALKSTAKWAKRGALVVGGASLKTGVEDISNMDEYVRKVKAIAGDELGMVEIEAQISDIRMGLGVGIDDIGETIYQAISSGVDIDIDTLTGITELSQRLSLTGYTDMADAVSLLASTGNVFGTTEMKDYERMANQLLRTQQLGKVEVGEMAQHYGNISSLTQAMEVPFEEQTAAIATMTRLGMSASDATTGYRSILNAFLKRTSDTQVDMLESLGLGGDFLSAATFQAKGFKGVIGEMVAATEGDMDKLAVLLPNIRATTGMTKFFGGGFEEYDWILNDIMDSEGVLDDAYDVVDNSIKRNWQKIRERIKEYNRRFFQETGFGDGLADLLSDISNWLIDNEDKVMKKLGKVADGVVEFSKKLADGVSRVWDERDKIKGIAKGLIMLYGTFKLLKTTGNALKWFDDISNVLSGIKLGTIVKGFPFAKVLIIIGILLSVGYGIKHIYDNWDELVEKYPAVGETIDNFGDKWEELSDIMDEHDVGGKISEGFSNILDDIKTSIEGISEIIVATIPIIPRFISAMAGAAKAIFGVVTINPKMAKEGWDQYLEGVEGIADDIRNIWDIREDKWLPQPDIENLEAYKEQFKIDGVFSEEAKHDIEEYETWITEMSEVSINPFGSLFESIDEIDITPKNWGSEFVLSLAGIEREAVTFGGIADNMKNKWNEFFNKTEEEVTGDTDIPGYQDWITKTTEVGNAWERLKKRITPIIGSMTMNTQPGLPSLPPRGIPGNYKGTSNWEGGLTWVHERGAELMDLPGGTRIYPRDRSLDMAKKDGYNMALAGGGGSVNNYNFGGMEMTFTGNIDSDVDINEIGTKITKRIIDELGNI